jgi:hypothetical protein
LYAFRPLTLSVFILIVSLSLLSCGTSVPRHLVSATVAPATADASDFSNGMVQFTATGMFDRSPSPERLNPAVWFIEQSSAYPQDAASIDDNEVAQCKPGFIGTVTVRGGGMVCPGNPRMGIPCQPVTGSAQLTCP